MFKILQNRLAEYKSSRIEHKLIFAQTADRNTRTDEESNRKKHTLTFAKTADIRIETHKHTKRAVEWNTH